MCQQRCNRGLKNRSSAHCAPSPRSGSVQDLLARRTRLCLFPLRVSQAYSLTHPLTCLRRKQSATPHRSHRRGRQPWSFGVRRSSLLPFANRPLVKGPSSVTHRHDLSSGHQTSCRRSVLLLYTPRFWLCATHKYAISAGARQVFTLPLLVFNTLVNDRRAAGLYPAVAAERFPGLRVSLPGTLACLICAKSRASGLALVRWSRPGGNSLLVFRCIN